LLACRSLRAFGLQMDAENQPNAADSAEPDPALASFASLTVHSSPEAPVERQIHSWHSPAVDRTLNVASWGHFGKPVIFFPTGGGDFLDVERFLMVRALSPLIEAGRIKLYAPDSVCRWTWASKTATPPEKSKLQARYDEYLVNELLPFIKKDCGDTEQRFAATGASIGGYNALNAVAKHPDWFDLMVGMSGTYVLDRRMEGYWDEDYYYNAPVQFVPRLEGELLEKLRTCMFVLARGQRYENPVYAELVSKVFTAREIPHRVEIWQGESGHDWPTWRTMLPLFLNRLV
jgi:esterase/lipase superfamily enzyme